MLVFSSYWMISFYNVANDGLKWQMVFLYRLNLYSLLHQNFHDLIILWTTMMLITQHYVGGGENWGYVIINVILLPWTNYLNVIDIFMTFSMESWILHCSLECHRGLPNNKKSNGHKSSLNISYRRTNNPTKITHI